MAQQCTAQALPKLLADDGAGGDRFGYSVDMSSDGSLVVVGSYGDDDSGSGSGSAYVFDATTGAQLYKLLADDAAAGDGFGSSVSVSSDGSRVLVGAVGVPYEGYGSAYVFNGTTGEQLHKFVADDGAAGDDFGYSVSVSSDGSQVVVGASGDGDRGSYSGSAYVFDGASGSRLHKLLADDGAIGSFFGGSVSVSSDGSRIVVGAYGDSDSGYLSGCAYVFDGATGAQLHKLLADDGAAGDYFGGSVSVSSNGSWVAVGAPYTGKSGAAYVFDGTTGAQVHRLLAGGITGVGRFGYSVSVSSDGGRVAVGAYGDDGRGSHSGCAYVFDGATGAQLHKLLADDGAAGGYFGVSLSVSSDGSWVAVGAPALGAPHESDSESYSGAAYVFDGRTGAQVDWSIATVAANARKVPAGLRCCVPLWLVPFALY